MECSSLIGQEECYTYSNGFLMVRGCSGHKNNEPTMCRDNPSDLCDKCSGLNCNNKSGSAVIVEMSIVLTVVSIVILLIN